ncbi:hypothetical protein RhiirA4_480079 [Rhizophagus irregularis]|uniref:Uncharacterized protein n=1 Tax=Rhizophagus irregularis TaxID=588596 RepID=A0A2I1HHD1_9GLOM|nr:hypothetical protein RhiirA4_480079 [Rhizophagus irregularis]
MVRPSRLSSDGDLLNVILPPGGYPTLSSASTLHFGSVSASTFQFESPTRAFGYANAGRLGGRKYRLNNVETTSIAGMTKESTSGEKRRGKRKIYVSSDDVISITPQILLQVLEKPHAWRANIDDDYVDNCEQEKAMILCQYAYGRRTRVFFEYWAAKFIAKGHVASALPFGLMSASFGLWIGINWFSRIG